MIRLKRETRCANHFHAGMYCEAGTFLSGFYKGWIEAQASGRPVIAYARGGALESVLGVFPGELVSGHAHTGVFFEQQSVECLVDAIRSFESMEQVFSPPVIRAHALQFDQAHFKRNFAQFVAAKWLAFNSNLAKPSVSRSHNHTAYETVCLSRGSKERGDEKSLFLL